MKHLMKKTTILCVLAGALAVSSCDSYLDIQPVGKVIPTTLTEYRELLTTAYYTSPIDRALTEFRTDIQRVSDSEYDKNSYADIETWNDTRQAEATTAFGWSDYYETIYYANAVIDKRNAMTEGTADEINQLVGEAYLLRAYQHFILVNLYGQPYTKPGAPETKAVPVKLTLDLEEVPSRQTVEQVYTSILEDIDAARGLLTKDTWEAALGYRFSKLALEAFEARVRLYRGEWAKAYELAEGVLALKPDLEDLNEADALCPNLYNSKETILAYEMMYSSSVARAALLRSEFAAAYYGEGDLRLAKYFGAADEAGNRPIEKAGSNQYRSSFRTAEMYLIAAEAAARDGRLPAARSRLLDLAAKRYTPEAYALKETSVNALGQEELIAAILDERARELACEGHRWFDLRRTTRPRLEKTIDGQAYVLEADDARYTLQIPNNAIEANPGLGN